MLPTGIKTVATMRRSTLVQDSQRDSGAIQDKLWLRDFPLPLWGG